MTPGVILEGSSAEDVCNKDFRSASEEEVLEDTAGIRDVDVAVLVKICGSLLSKDQPWRLWAILRRCFRDGLPAS